MKKITESLKDITSMSSYISNKCENSQVVDESLKDLFKLVKNKFKQVYQWAKGLVANVQNRYMPVDENGDLLSANTPMTAGAAYKNGFVKTNSTFVHMAGEAAKITKLNNKPEGAESLYGSGNSLQYWKRKINESRKLGTDKMVNEVHLAASDPQIRKRYGSPHDQKMLMKKIYRRLSNPTSLKPLLIWGAPGIGKTAILKSVLKTYKEFKDYHLIVKTLSNETPDNFTLPTYVEKNGHKAAADIPKDWLPVWKPTGNEIDDKKANEGCGYGLLFLDELSRATPQVLNVILPLVNEREFNGWKLGDGWCVIAASNRMEDEDAGQSNLGNALMTRFAHVYYEPTVDTWRDWADKQSYISPLLLQWLSLPVTAAGSGGKFYYYDWNEANPDEEDTTHVMCTPRSWTDAMEEMAVISDTGKLEGWELANMWQDPDLREELEDILSSYIPAQAIDSFVSYIEMANEVGNIDKIVEGAWKSGKMKLPARSVNKLILPLAQMIIVGGPSYREKRLPTEKEFNNIAKALIDLNNDSLASAAMDVLQRSLLPNNDLTLPKGESYDLDNSAGDQATYLKLWTNLIMMHRFIEMYNEQVASTGDPDGKLAQKYKNWTNALAPAMKHWGVSSLEEIPDYKPAFVALAKAYSEKFAKYQAFDKSTMI